jgi:hypothetical protein
MRERSVPLGEVHLFLLSTLYRIFFIEYSSLFFAYQKMISRIDNSVSSTLIYGESTLCHYMSDNYVIHFASNLDSFEELKLIDCDLIIY